MKSGEITTWLWRWAPPLLWMGAIFAVSSISTLPGPEVYFWDFILKKSAHMIEYAILFFLWQRAINWDRPKEKNTYLLAFVITVLYAVSDEYHQSFTPNRHPNPVDVGFDSLGAFIMYVKLKGFI